MCLTSLAKRASPPGEIGRLNDTIGYCNRRISSLSSAVNRLEAARRDDGEVQTSSRSRSYLLALDQFPEKVRDFDRLFRRSKRSQARAAGPKPKARHRDDRGDKGPSTGPLAFLVLLFAYYKSEGKNDMKEILLHDHEARRSVRENGFSNRSTWSPGTTPSQLDLEVVSRAEVHEGPHAEEEEGRKLFRALCTV